MRSALLVLLLCVGCEQQNPLQLVPVTLPDDPATHGGGPAGFSCRFQSPRPDGTAGSYLLFQRAAEGARTGGLDPAFGGATAMGSAVVDLLSLPPGPSDADPFVVISRCGMSPCTPIVRKCFPIDLTQARDAVDRDGPDAKGTTLDTIFAQLHAEGALVTNDAPRSEVLVRMVTTTLSCDQIGALPLRFSEWPRAASTRAYGKSIFGCGYAGPFVLASVHNTIFLGLPTLDAVSCVPQAAICAADLDPQQAAALLNLTP